jgi:hypothetical protein
VEKIMDHVNAWAVGVAALTSFTLGGLWYSPMMFLDVWAKESGVDPRTNDKGRHPAMVFGFAFALAFIAAFFFAVWIGPDPTPTHAITQGLTVGLAFVAGSFGINYLFGGNSFKLWLVNAGYHVVQFALYGLVLGFWP